MQGNTGRAERDGALSGGAPLLLPSLLGFNKGRHKIAA